VDHESDAQTRGDLRRGCFDGQVQDRRGGQYVHARQISETRHQRIRETETQALIVPSFLQQQGRQDCDRRAVAPIAGVGPFVDELRRSPIVRNRILGIDHANRADESVSLSDDRFKKA
jgi:hypothetical protein